MGAMSFGGLQTGCLPGFLGARVAHGKAGGFCWSYCPEYCDKEGVMAEGRGWTDFDEIRIVCRKGTYLVYWVLVKQGASARVVGWVYGYGEGNQIEGGRRVGGR